MHSLNQEYVQSLIRHATQQRNTAANTNFESESILVSDKMWDQLNAMPYVSCKSFFMSHAL